MKAVKVRYTVKPSFVDENKANINAVMAAIRSNPIAGLHYAAYVLEDGQTFIHVNVVNNEAALSKLTEMPEFKAFQAALRASEPLSPPAPEKMLLVASSFDV